MDFFNFLVKINFTSCTFASTSWFIGFDAATKELMLTVLCANTAALTSGA